MDYIKISINGRRLYINENGELLVAKKVSSSEEIIETISTTIADSKRIIIIINGYSHDLDTLKAGLKDLSKKLMFLRILINEDDYTDEVTGEKKDIINRIADVTAAVMQSIRYSTGYKTSSTWVEEFFGEEEYSINFDDCDAVKKFIEYSLYELSDIRQTTPVNYVLTGIDNGVDTIYGVPGGAIPPRDLINEIICYLNDNINIVKEVLPELA